MMAAAEGAGLRSWLKALARRIPAPPGRRFSSADYWERRYASGGTSGVGSAGELAAFKAEVVNGFVREHHVASVLDLGCGDGRQAALLDCPKYLGLDVSPAAVALCGQLSRDDPRKRFAVYEPDRFDEHLEDFRTDLALSLDVLYHLVEDRVYERYLAHLFGSAGRFVMIYSCDDVRHPTLLAPHVRPRGFTRDVASRFADWRLLAAVPNRYPPDPQTGEGSWCDFAIYARTDHPPEVR